MIVLFNWWMIFFLKRQSWFHAVANITVIGNNFSTPYRSINCTTRSICSIGTDINKVGNTVFFSLQRNEFRRLNISAPVVRVGRDFNILQKKSRGTLGLGWVMFKRFNTA